MSRSAERTTAVLLALLAAAVLAAGAGRALDLLTPDLAKRAVGLSFGAMLLVTGNMLPKLAQPLSGLRDPAAAMAADRSAGGMLLLLGLALCALFAFAPMAKLMLVASVLGIAAMVGVAVMWVMVARREQLPALNTAQGMLLLLLHTLLWVFAMFFVDQVWGDQAAQWLSIGFVIVQSAGVSFLGYRTLLAE